MYNGNSPVLTKGKQFSGLVAGICLLALLIITIIVILTYSCGR
ncbi:MAG TPA: hypothetical protein PLX10_00170 [Candidatus Paceibacterota bacterium]|nr:hypothetical protein [Candidatus Paceibacterota bacterium]